MRGDTTTRRSRSSTSATPPSVPTGSSRDPLNLPLPTLLDRLDELDPARPTVVYCAGGYRSAIAASLLRARGFGTVADLLGGYAATTGPVLATT